MSLNQPQPRVRDARPGRPPVLSVPRLSSPRCLEDAVEPAVGAAPSLIGRSTELRGSTIPSPRWQVVRRGCSSSAARRGSEERIARRRARPQPAGGFASVQALHRAVDALALPVGARRAARPVAGPGGDALRADARALADGAVARVRHRAGHAHGGVHRPPRRSRPAITDRARARRPAMGGRVRSRAAHLRRAPRLRSACSCSGRTEAPSRRAAIRSPH